MNRRTLTAFVGGIIVAGYSLEVCAEMKDNPYHVISVRNPFGLRPVPPPAAPPDNTPPPPPTMDIKLTGITTLLGPAKVFLEFTDPQSKKVDRPSAMLEGETYDKANVTIVAIDAENNRVKVRNADGENWLDFDKNGIKPGSATPGAPVPHPAFAGANPAGVPPVPGAQTAAAAAAAAAGGGPARGGLVGGNTAAAPAAAPFNNAAVSALGGLPARPVRTDGAGLIGGSGAPVAAAPQAAQAPPMTPIQAQQIIEARRIQLEEKGDRMSRILPPTPLGQQLNLNRQPGQ